ncbi:hypothetical protein [Paraburkholderia sp. BL21I4N1]|uniref:hypothetical protein n=1 Tax=Paraburkholderia sp. BL21I4N1 TaxID=1938801 RepID=UPI000D41DE0F|nr:hypothetical protein [Paraburkholderia sp. BL21I4N1]PQV52188.1 hypothetical protein B0G83_104408 [Paraburkholderia sp. BL21I4N1]
MKRILCALAAYLAVVHSYAAPLDHGDLVTFPTRDGVTQSIFVESSSSNPPWVIALFGGTPGSLHLDATGATTLRGNFVIRSAHHWIEQGDAVALVDTPSDHPNGIDDSFRLSKESFTDTQAVVTALRQRFPNSKIALVSTSAGTMSVGNALDRDRTLADAFVLTSPVTVPHKGSPSLASLDFESVKSENHRVLIVSNADDGCVSSPAFSGKRFAKRSDFDYVEVESSEGAGERGEQCGAHSPHGYLGIERQVLDDINNWLTGQPVAAK